MKQKRAEIH